jgi:hypothetical protein
MQPERRGETRRPAAFGLWFRLPGREQPAAAWMLNLSTRGAAFLAAAEDAPDVGERLELGEMHSANRSVREAAAGLPSHARVLRVDDPDTPTRRIAVQFETGVSEPLGPDRRDAAAAWCTGRRPPGRSRWFAFPGPWQPVNPLQQPVPSSPLPLPQNAAN